MSLERKLPLIVIAVLVATLATAVGLAYREVRTAGEAASAARLQTVTRQLASLSAVSIATRAKLLHEVAQSAAVRAAVANDVGEPPVTASKTNAAAAVGAKIPKPTAAQLVLKRLVLPTDTALAIELWSADGKLIDHVGDTPETAAAATDTRQSFSIPGIRSPQTAMPRGDSARFLPFFEGRDHQVYYWMTVPVMDRGVHVGWIAEQARIKPRPGADKQINALLGDHTAAYFRNTTDSFWTTLGGNPVQPPSMATGALPPAIANGGEVTSYTRPRHGGVLSTTLPIDGTSWQVVVEADHAAVVAGARSLLLKFTLFSLPLLVAAAAVSWLLIRRALRPLVDLTEAATSMSRGDYSARVEVEHEDEVGRLGMSFNTMATEVDASQSRLAGQVQEAHRLALELDRARDVAVTASKAKSNFLATMSHEIRTPINAIIGYADILDLGISGPLTTKQQENVHRIRTSSSHLLALVNDVLDLSRIESGTLQLSLARVNTRQSIDAAVALVEPTATTKRIRIVVETDDQRSATFVGDERGVQQSLANLLSNAVKFTNPDGEIRISTSLSSAFAASEVLDPDRLYVAITVADTGIGIDAEQIGLLFQPFTQLEADGGNPYTRQTSGAGLGLSISRHLARMMGGDITVESVPQQGSTFTLWLPHERVGTMHVENDTLVRSLDLNTVGRAEDA